MTNDELRYPRLLAEGDAAVTVEFGAAIDPAVNDLVLAFARAVEEQGERDWPGLVEAVPTYRSVTLYFDPLVAGWQGLADRLITLAAGIEPVRKAAPWTVEVPVLYGGEFGPDLNDVAAFAGCSPDEVVALHSSVTYRVYMLGFSPGFPYLGSVPPALAMPRLATPRASVPAGSVGLAGSQTGIYPQESPGGWRIIGRTPWRLYDPARSEPFLIEPGNQVRFVPIDQAAYERLSSPSNPVPRA
jgi:KipI family sensor histidine kinase inhibitor